MTGTEIAPDEAVPARPAVRPPPGADRQSDGRAGRLPQIGAAAPAAEPAPAPPGVAGMPPAEAPAWQRHARPFADPAGRPPFAIILIDGGLALDRAALAAAPLPLTLAIDPSLPQAAAIAAEWRAAGQEIVLLGAGLPEGATAVDAETALEALLSVLPEAVAVLDTPVAGLQGDARRAAVLTPALATRGLALVTWDRGLNPADQAARRAGLPVARVFRELDGGGEDPAAVRRHLDRAVLRAAQEGRVVVAGRLRPETLTAIADWAASPRAAEVAVAPLSAALTPP